MGYQVLARKWRPKTFDELAGQEHVLKALVNALENQRLHHAYLFTGTRGVGKTTIARILARSLNCETGITASPCGTCSACQEINEGRFVDLIEVDAASRTKVEDTRDLLENIQYRPTRGRYKIYLIDEVHMLSTHSFNALLKTLEEPPEHVKFLLATTDPQKLPVTVLSRCLQFNLKNLTSARIQEYLQFVLGEEKVPSEIEALWHLARAARGSMRDALSLTDQAISHGGGKLSEADVVTMLGTVDRKRIYELMDALVVGDAEKVLQIAASLAEFSPDYFALVEDMLVLMHSIAVYQRVPQAQKSEGFEEEKLAGYAQSFSPEDVQLIYQMLLMGSKDLKVTPDLHIGFEMLLLRLIAFQPTKEGEVLADEGTPVKKPEVVLKEHLEPIADSGSVTDTDSASDHLVNDSSDLSKPAEINQTFETEVCDPVQPENKTEVENEPEFANSHEPETVQTEESFAESNEQAVAYAECVNGQSANEEIKAEPDTLQPKTEHIESFPNKSEPVLEILNDEDAGPAPRNRSDLTSENWIALFRNLPLKGMVRTLCAHLVVEENTGAGLKFILTEPGQKVFEQSHQDKLVQALTDYFGEPINVQVSMGDVEQETPAKYADRRYQEKLVEAEKSILLSPLVQKLVEEFGAELVPGSVHLNTLETQRH